MVNFSRKLAKLVEFILERYILFQDFPNSFVKKMTNLSQKNHIKRDSFSFNFIFKNKKY